MSKSKQPGPGRNVSFQSGYRPGDIEKKEIMNIRSSSPDGPTNTAFKHQDRKWQRFNRHEQNVDPSLMPRRLSLIEPTSSPFLVYTDEFANVIGEKPRLELSKTDIRAPFFHAGGVFISRLSTLFLTSNLLRDDDPAAVTSANQRTEITKITLYSSSDFSRDKVRIPERSYMAAGVAEYPDGQDRGLIICAQGSLNEPSGLVYIDTKRPHKSHVLINNFQGRPFNSPCDIVANKRDGGLYFTDPGYGFERGFRNKPQLPTSHIYRFDPESGDCRVVANGHSRPGGLAIAPDGATLYVSELGDKYGGTTIIAYTLSKSTSLRADQTSVHVSVSRNGTDSAAHKSTPSNSTNGSHNSSMGGSGGPYNVTDPLSPRVIPLDGIKVPPLSRQNSNRSHVRGSSDMLQSPRPTLGSRAQSYLSSLTQNQPVQPVQPVSASVPRTTPTRSNGPFLINRRVFAYTATSSSSGLISTDPRSGHLFLGTEDGVEVFSCNTGDLIGKIITDENEGLPIEPEITTNDETIKKRKRRKYMKGVSKVAFGVGGEFWLLGGERLWSGKLDWGGIEGLIPPY